jgi:hypothetical protein
MKVSVETMVPCLFGVLTVLDKQQAIQRSSGEDNEGASWGMSAVEMGLNRMAAMGIGLAAIKADSGDQPKPFWNLDNAPGGQDKAASAGEDGKEGGEKKKEKKRIGF